MNFLEFIEKALELQERFNQITSSCEHEFNTTWNIEEDNSNVMIPLPLKRKCDFCQNFVTIKKDAFSLKEKKYPMPYCKSCNTIFKEDVDKIILEEFKKEDK